MPEHEHCWHMLTEARERVRSGFYKPIENAYVDQCCWCGLYRDAEGRTGGGQHGPFVVEWDSRMVEISSQVIAEISRAMRGRR